MRTAGKILFVIVGASVVTLAVSGFLALQREDRVLRVQPGMHRAEVERLLGPGAPDVSFDVTEENPKIEDQHYYRANPSLWYGRFEDNLIVRYSNGRVVSISRIGL